MISAALVDAFTTAPFKGNPAVVMLLSDGANDAQPEWMQQVARELNASETCFLVPHGAKVYGLRWFTPGTEVDLCGHATLAAAHWLWERGETAEVLHFETLSGQLSASRRRSDGLIWLDFPTVPIIDDCEMPDWRDAFSGTNLDWVGRTGGSTDLQRDALFVTDAQSLRRLAPDFERIAAFPCRGVIVTALSDTPNADVLTRYFAPACGVNEDPVTGSAHCTVAWYWERVLKRSSLRAWQASPRGGGLYLEIEGKRCRLGGSAVTVAHFEFLA